MTTGTSETPSTAVVRQAQLTHTLAHVLMQAIITRLDRSAPWSSPHWIPAPQARWGVSATAASVVAPLASVPRPSHVVVVPGNSFAWHP